MEDTRHQHFEEVLHLYGLKNMRELEAKLGDLKKNTPDDHETTLLKTILWTYHQEMDFSAVEVTRIIKALFDLQDKLKRNDALPEDIESYQTIIEKFIAYRNKYFNEGEWIDTLMKVGPTKPMGYYHAAEIKDYGYSFDDIARMATQRGLKTKKFPAGFSGESIYFYDEDTLRRFLKKNEYILTEAHWPSEPEEFIDKVSQKMAEPGTELFDVVAGAFGDEENKRLNK